MAQTLIQNNRANIILKDIICVNMCISYTLHYYKSCKHRKRYYLFQDK